MNRDDVVQRYIYTTAGDLNKVNEVKDLMLEIVPTDFHEKCTACSCSEESYAPVPGVGNVGSSVVLIGRNPGSQDDRTGVPFVGPGGELLDKYIQWVGLDRNNLYITNLVKCYTEGDRIPKQAEINICMLTWLKRELYLIKPKLIITFGVEACAAMTGMSTKDMHMKMVTYPPQTEGLAGTSVISMVHPGHALRNNQGYQMLRRGAMFTKVKCRELGIIIDDVESIRETAQERII